MPNLIGSAANQVSVNGMLGTLAFEDADNPKLGAVVVDTLRAAASTTTSAGINIPHGTTPTSPVNGDVWTTTAGVFARVNGSTKTLDVVSAGLTLLATVTPTAAVNVDFLTTFSGTYDSYLIIGSGIKFASNEGLILRLANAGTADTGSNYVNLPNDITVSGLITFAEIIPGSTIASANKGSNFEIIIQNVNSATEIKTIMFRSTSNTTASSSSYYFDDSAAAYNAANAVSGFRLAGTGGSNFAAVGKIRVYGYSNS